MQMLSYCCYNCSLHFHCNLNWNLAKTLAKFTLTSKYISDETGDRSFLTVLQLLKLLSGGRMKNRSRNSRIWIIWIFTIIGKRLGMCRQRAGEWALPPLRIFNIQIINIPPVGDSDLGPGWLFLIYAKRWLSLHEPGPDSQARPSISGQRRIQAHHSLDKRNCDNIRAENGFFSQNRNPKWSNDYLNFIIPVHRS